MNRSAISLASVFIATLLCGRWVGGIVNQASGQAEDGTEGTQQAHSAARRGRPLTDRESLASTRKTTPSRDKLAMRSSDEFAAAFAAEVAGNGSTERLFQIMCAWGHQFPEEFIEWGRRQPLYLKVPGSGRISVVHTLLSTAVRQDPDAAWQLAREIAATSKKAAENRWTVAEQVMRQRPAAEARDFISKHRAMLGSSDEAPGLYGVSPELATPCVMELPPGAARTKAFQELSRYYVDKFGTIEEAAAWFQTLPQEARQQVAAAAQSASDFQYTICPKEHLEQLRQAWPLPQ